MGGSSSRASRIASSQSRDSQGGRCHSIAEYPRRTGGTDGPTRRPAAPRASTRAGDARKGELLRGGRRGFGAGDRLRPSRRPLREERARDPGTVSPQTSPAALARSFPSRGSPGWPATWAAQSDRDRHGSSLRRGCSASGPSASPRSEEPFGGERALLATASAHRSSSGVAPDEGQPCHGASGEARWPASSRSRAQTRFLERLLGQVEVLRNGARARPSPLGDARREAAYVDPGDPARRPARSAEQRAGELERISLRAGHAARRGRLPSPCRSPAPATRTR